MSTAFRVKTEGDNSNAYESFDITKRKHLHYFNYVFYEVTYQKHEFILRVNKPKPSHFL